MVKTKFLPKGGHGPMAPKYATDCGTHVPHSMALISHPCVPAQDVNPHSQHKRRDSALHPFMESRSCVHRRLWARYKREIELLSSNLYTSCAMSILQCIRSHTLVLYVSDISVTLERNWNWNYFKSVPLELKLELELFPERERNWNGTYLKLLELELIVTIIIFRLIHASLHCMINFISLFYKQRY